MNTVLRTRLTLKGFHSYVLKLNLEPHFFTQFLIRPDYKIKFGLPAVRFPRFPWLEELFCTGAEAILIPKSPG